MINNKGRVSRITSQGLIVKVNLNLSSMSMNQCGGDLVRFRNILHEIYGPYNQG